MKTLDEIGTEHGTDKASWQHNYLVRYEPYFDTLPRPLKLLEIGVFTGASIKTWLDYLPESEIHGIEIDVSNMLPIANDRFTLHIGNACDENLWSKLGMYDVIIDDGSHMSHQIKQAFDLGFSHLNPGGIWVIEDVDTAYHEQFTLPGDPVVIDQFRSLIDELNDFGIGLCGNHEFRKGRIAYIHFSKSIMFIGKSK